MANLAHEDELRQLRERVASLESELKSRSEADVSCDDYRYAIELNPQVSWSATAEGVIADFNQRWLDLTGLTREQALTVGWNDIPHPEDLPSMLEAWTHSIQTGEPFDKEHRIRVRSGEYRWVRSRAFPRRDSLGKVMRWYGTTEDIDERKKTELLLQNSEQVFGAAFAEAPIGMVLTTPDGRILEVNQAYREMLGYRNEDLAGKNSAAITHPEDVAATVAFFQNLQHSNSSKAVIEKRYVRADGRILWARASATMRRDAEGRPMQVVAIIEDITERVLAEAERERLMRQLEAERKRLDAVAAQMPSGLIIADASGQLTFFNSEAERILAHPLSNLDQLQHGVTQNGDRVPVEEYPLTRALLYGDVVRNCEIPYRKGDGTLTTLQVSAGPIHAEAGSISGAVANLQRRLATQAHGAGAPR